MAHIRNLPRPMIFHFLSVVDVASREDNRVSMVNVYDSSVGNNDKYVMT
jgi:hypothetical protein